MAGHGALSGNAPDVGNRRAANIPKGSEMRAVFWRLYLLGCGLLILLVVCWATA